jgi:hypothetical protein
MNFLPAKLNILATFMAFLKLIHMHGSIKIFKTWARFVVKIVCIKTNLVILKVLPFYTLASGVLTLLETFLPDLFWCGHELCCCSMLNFFYESNIKIFETILEP